MESPYQICILIEIIQITFLFIAMSNGDFLLVCLHCVFHCWTFVDFYCGDENFGYFTVRLKLILCCVNAESVL